MTRSTTSATRQGHLGLVGLVGLLGLAAVACGDDGSPADTLPAATTVVFGPDQGDGVLRIEFGVPSGDRGTAEAASIELAVQDVNLAGGFDGEPVGLRGPEADVFVGVAPADLAAEGMVQIAPSGPTVVTPQDGRLTFRTGASSDLVAQAAADLVAEDGSTTVGVVALDDEVAGAVGAALATVGVDVEVQADESAAIVDAAPEAVVLAGAADAAPVIEELVAAGFSPADHAFYVVGATDGSTLGDALADRSGVIEDVKALIPGAEVTGELRDRILEAHPDLVDLSGAAEAYDAVVIAALAATAAGTDDPARLGAQVAGVTEGGSTCTTYEECVALLGDGEDIDFVGDGGSYALGDDGRPTQGVVGVVEYGADNRLDPNRTEYRVAILPG